MHGPFGSMFPYTDFHAMNTDWLIQIARDFLDQYTHIQETIENGEESLTNLTTSGLEQLQDKADALTDLLQSWYDDHSADIADQLAAALGDLNSWYTEHSGYLDQYVTDSITLFTNLANAKALETLESIPDDYTDVALAVKNIIPEYTAFMKTGKNLFVPYTLKKGILISPTHHTEGANANYDTSDYIPVVGGQQYTIRYVGYLFYYDTSKEFVSLDTNQYQTQYDFTPAQTGYIRFSNNIESESNLYNTEHNIVALSSDYYINMPYTYDFDENYNGLSRYIGPVNLIASLTNGYMRRTDGAIAGPTGPYRTSNLIKIDPNAWYYFYNARPDFGGFFDNKGVYIPTSGNLTNPFRASDYVTGAEFVRVTGFNDQVGLYTRPISKYIPIGYNCYNEQTVNLNAPVNLDVFLPPDFYLVTGSTIEIFNETLISEPEANGYYFRWTSDGGVYYERKFVFSSENTGNFTVNLKIYDKFFNILFDGNTVIHVVDKLNVSKTIVPVGDSLTNGKPWLRYIAEDIAQSNITFTGTRWHDTGTGPDALIKHEGRSGWRASSYTHDTTYTFDDDGVSDANPFWNPSAEAFSLDYYISHYNISPDGIQFFLGTNGLNLAPNTEENAMYNMVSKIRTEHATMPIFICYPIHTANQNGLGRQSSGDGYDASQEAFYPEKKLAMWNFIKRLYVRCSDIPFVYFVPVCQCFDHEYMFGQTEVQVNQYSNVTEIVPTEAIHPRDYHQFINPMYGAYSYAFR